MPRDIFVHDETWKALKLKIREGAEDRDTDKLPIMHSMPNHLQQKNTNYFVQNIRSAAVEKLTESH